MSDAITEERTRDPTRHLKTAAELVLATVFAPILFYIVLLRDPMQTGGGLVALEVGLFTVVVWLAVAVFAWAFPRGTGGLLLTLTVLLPGLFLLLLLTAYSWGVTPTGLDEFVTFLFFAWFCLGAPLVAGILLLRAAVSK